MTDVPKTPGMMHIHEIATSTPIKPRIVVHTDALYSDHSDGKILWGNNYFVYI